MASSYKRLITRNIALSEARSVGTLTVISGPMMSGKSSRLIAEGKTLQRNGFNCLYISHSSDTARSCSPNNIVTHAGERCACMSVETLCDIQPDAVRGMDVVLVDECQFFTDAVDCVQLYRTMGIHVVVAGLATDYMQRPWPCMAHLMALSTHHVQLRATCKHCNRSMESTAVYTARIHLDRYPNDEERSKDPLEAVRVGGAEMYVPLCATHYHVYRSCPQVDAVEWSVVADGGGGDGQ